jgi:hypothetical protein
LNLSDHYKNETIKEEKQKIEDINISTSNHQIKKKKIIVMKDTIRGEITNRIYQLIYPRNSLRPKLNLKISSNYQPNSHYIVVDQSVNLM